MNEANHVTIESVSTDDAIEAIELLWGHAMAYCNEYRPSGVKEVRDAKHTLTRLWLERDALLEENTEDKEHNHESIPSERPTELHRSNEA